MTICFRYISFRHLCVLNFYCILSKSFVILAILQLKFGNFEFRYLRRSVFCRSKFWPPPKFSAYTGIRTYISEIWNCRFQKFWKKNFGKKMLKKNVGKKFWQKKLWKNKLQKKNIHNKIYSNIDKCHTIFALLAPFDRTGTNENVCGIWFKIGSDARSHWTQGMWRFERSLEKKDIIMACELSVTRLLHERYLLHQWYEKFQFGLAPKMTRRVPQKSRMFCISCRTVLNLPVLIIVSLWC